MITELARTRFSVVAINQAMGTTTLEVYSADNVNKPAYSKKLAASEIEYAQAFISKIKKSFNQMNGKRSDK